MNSCFSRLQANPWPASIIGFFGVAMVGFGVFIWFCNRNPSELIAPDYYEQEIRYQAQMDRIRNAQEGLGAANVCYDAQSRIIRIAFRENSGTGSVKGQVQLYRPSAVNQDRYFPLQPSPDGTHCIDAAQLAPGLWKVKVSWSADNRDYYLDQKVVIGTPAS